MSIVLAAVDSSAAARPVLETALGLAELTGATAEAVHVTDTSAETPEALAARGGVRFRVLDGPVEAALLDAAADPAVIAMVLGARGSPVGRRPAGRTAIRVLERAGKPVVVVPPEAAGLATRPFRRLLVPLEGTEPTSRCIAEGLLPLLVADVELVVVHVFTSDTLPRFLDRPARDLQLFGDEFLARYCPDAARIRLRTGSVGTVVTDVCREEEADLIALSWSQDSSLGRGAVVLEVLGRSTVPVLVLPVGSSGRGAAHGEPGPPPGSVPS